MPRRARPRLDREVARLRRVALDAAAAGLYVFPVQPGGKLPAVPRHSAERCRRRGICAEGHQGWEQRATRDRAQICRWWSGDESARFNVGIACGPSGIVVIDLDTSTEPVADWGGATTGREVLDQLAARHGETLTDTYSVRTPTDGEHVYYRMPEGLQLRNTHGGHGHSLGPLIDTRAGGGFVVGAGSVRPEGAYLVAEHGQIAALPAWLATLLTPPPAPQRPTTTRSALSTKRANAYIAAILRDETDKVTRAAKGRRQITLLDAARVFGQLVGGGELDADNAQAVLLEAAAAHIGIDGFTRAEAERTVTRGMNYGMQAPRTIGHRDDPRSEIGDPDNDGEEIRS
ncbi:bifunctional DNA primase/polymerase [Pseudonocardia sp. C8]|uniref:bifunctional DNA primase/polymerase n=1 Tax=Pseudonocardia sp. C8 TaxID=2762759 RepID=UPI001643646F|nr:bifunctional DNA primase/polymerase [Pseudonocardia sp. C8]MBC3189460.1 bifunctional DNA primase/polymerase [Pseudonocardia sp. C8]